MNVLNKKQKKPWEQLYSSWVAWLHDFRMKHLRSRKCQTSHRRWREQAALSSACVWYWTACCLTTSARQHPTSSTCSTTSSRRRSWWRRKLSSSSMTSFALLTICTRLGLGFLVFFLLEVVLLLFGWLVGCCCSTDSLFVVNLKFLLQRLQT